MLLAIYSFVSINDQTLGSGRGEIKILFVAVAPRADLAQNKAQRGVFGYVYAGLGTDLSSVESI